MDVVFVLYIQDRFRIADHQFKPWSLIRRGFTSRGRGNDYHGISARLEYLLEFQFASMLGFRLKSARTKHGFEFSVAITSFDDDVEAAPDTTHTKTFDWPVQHQAKWCWVRPIFGSSRLLCFGNPCCSTGVASLKWKRGTCFAGRLLFRLKQQVTRNHLS